MRPKRIGVVVLAGGGRLRTMVPDGAGGLVSRAFCAGSAAPSFREALARARGLTNDLRIRVSVLEAERPMWASEVAGLPPTSILAQPADRGSAVGVFLPFLQLFRKDPSLVMLVLPSELQVLDGAILDGAIADACARAGKRTERLFLVGAAPDGGLGEGHWLLPVPHGTVEVPLLVEASRGNRGGLRERGALHFTGIAVGSTAAFLMAFDRGMPALLPLLARYGSGRDLDRIDWAPAYREMPYGSFRRHVLRPASDHLGLVRMAAGGLRAPKGAAAAWSAERSGAPGGPVMPATVAAG